MEAGKIIEKLEEQFPLSLAMDWDNPGLQVGRLEKKVKKVYVALDATDEVIADCVAWEADLLLTHHPLMLSGIRQVNGNSMTGRKVLALVEHGIAHYAMHTNYDVAKMAGLAQEALKLKKCRPLEVTGTDESGQTYGIGSVGELSGKKTAADCCELVKKAFGLENVRLYGNGEAPVKTVAVCPGSGKSMIGCAIEQKAQILITGDIGHHDGLDAMDQGLMIIDAGHYGIEHIFIAQMADYILTAFPKLKVKTAGIRQPFHVV